MVPPTLEDPLPPDLGAREAALRELLGGFESVAVAYSGGVDSSYLLAACVEALGAERVLALTAESPLMPSGEIETARAVAEMVGARHRVVPMDELAIPEIAANPALRCYYCKRARFQALQALAQEVAGGSATVQLVHGENADDGRDYRPGSRAARELGVRAPLAEAGLTKSDIRILSRRRGLPTWDHPAEACLATRFPYDTPLTPEGLRRVDRGERALRELTGLRQARLRDLPADAAGGRLARIEVAPEAIARLAEAELRARIAQRLRELGYQYVTLDLVGYRTGSMNETIRQP